jgi:hypothetical protein
MSHCTVYKHCAAQYEKTHAKIGTPEPDLAITNSKNASNRRDESNSRNANNIWDATVAGRPATAGMQRAAGKQETE